jgi:hypothetical protein
MFAKNLTLAAIGFLLAIPATTSGASAQSATLFAVLNGASECNGATPPLCGQGDANGVGSATVMLLGPTHLCATIIVNNIAAPTAAHIHTGPTGVNGGVAIALTTPATGSPGTSVFCTAAAPAGLTSSIRNNPQNFYINVHNVPFPAGAVRGQLF